MGGIVNEIYVFKLIKDKKNNDINNNNSNDSINKDKNLFLQGYDEK